MNSAMVSYKLTNDRSRGLSSKISQIELDGLF
jgi:hypothetical protein